MRPMQNDELIASVIKRKPIEEKYRIVKSTFGYFIAKNSFKVVDKPTTGLHPGYRIEDNWITLDRYGYHVASLHRKDYFQDLGEAIEAFEKIILADARVFEVVKLKFDIKLNSKKDSIHGLDKIPDSELVKIQNIKIGKLNAYIDELKDSIKGINISDQLQNRIKNLENKNIELNNILNKKDRRNQELEDEVRKLNKQYEILQRQLIHAKV